MVSYSLPTPFTIIPLIVITGFIVIFSMLIVRAIQGAKQWKKNNDLPKLTVEATVVTKRSDVSYRHHHTGTDHTQGTINTSTTDYYVTFEVLSGDRMEFLVRDDQYGMLVERDFGKLTFQGTRFLGFERNRPSNSN